MSAQLDAALEYFELGLQPVAAPLRGKSPRGAWKSLQNERTTERLIQDSFRRPSNVVLITGSIGQVAVLDCDNDVAVEYWRKRLGSILDRTACVQTSNGYHFYFRLGVGQIERNRSVDDESGKWDIRAEGGLVVAPPSIHPTGHVYEWVRDLSHLEDAPRELFEGAPSGEGGGDAPRSILTHLLANPPAEGSRNDWLSRVAGHYAKHIPHEDAFAQMVQDANQKLSPPLPSEEVEKLIPSIWSAERAKQGKEIPELDEAGSDRWRKNLMRPTENTGWLVSGGNHIAIETMSKVDGGYAFGLAPWLNCDIRVLGVIESEQDLIYSVELRLKKEGVLVEDHVSSSVISDPRQLAAWLARHRASIAPPNNASQKSVSSSTRLLRYMEAQEAQPMVAAEALGWDSDSEAFITHEGIIRASGPARFENVRPDPTIRGWAPYVYGHDLGAEEAIRVLSEVLTFHDEVVTSVFGAWWAACLLKPQIQVKSSQFPFMAIEASSESGKTKGFFPLMNQLAGSQAGQINPTKAALRDYLSANNNGIVWVDDLDDLSHLGEILRQVTVGGSLAKKGNENHDQVVAKMRSALVVSGEALGLQDQKALVDRAIHLKVESPLGRQSLHGDYAQWDDVITLTRAYPDLTVFAGNIVQLALQRADVCDDLKSLRVGAGRHADTLAILRVGARVLASILGSAAPPIVDTVDAWAKEESSNYTGKENVLTLKLLPRALRRLDWPLKPDPPIGDVGATPAIVRPDELGNEIVWFSPVLLAEWWEREAPARRGVDQRTTTIKALESQARALGMGGSRADHQRKPIKFNGGNGKAIYWKVPRHVSELVLQRSRGEEGAEDADDDSRLS